MQHARAHTAAPGNEIAIDLQIANADGKVVRLQGHIELGGPRLSCDLSVSAEDIWTTARLEDEDEAEDIESALLRLTTEQRPRRGAVR
jgi:hypothetical protein